MKILIEIKKFQDNSISQIYLPCVNQTYSLPDISFSDLEHYLETHVYDQIINDIALLRQLLSFKNEDYSEKNTLFVTFEIEAGKNLGVLPTYMPWVGRSMLFLTFIVASINSFLATVSQGDENNANTALGIVGVFINLMVLPLLYKYSHADTMYQSFGLMIEETLSNIKNGSCVTRIEHNTNDNTILPVLEESTNKDLQNTSSCSVNNLTTKAMFGFVYLTAVVSFVIQYIEYSNGIKSLNDNAARNGAPSFPPSVMPFLSIAVGVIAALNKTAVEGSFLYRGAEYIRNRFFLEIKKHKTKSNPSCLTLENEQSVYDESAILVMDPEVEFMQYKLRGY